MAIPADPEELAALADVIDRWLVDELAANPAVLEVERDVDGPNSWFIRIRGETKDSYTVRFHLGQRTLQYETHFMPAPQENREQLFEHLLRRNALLYGGSFAIGDEGAIFLRGRLDNSLVGAEWLDRVLGSLYAWVEQFFLPAIRIGFASRFTPLPPAAGNCS